MLSKQQTVEIIVRFLKKFLLLLVIMWLQMVADLQAPELQAPELQVPEQRIIEPEQDLLHEHE